MYAIVPITNTVLDLDYKDVLQIVDLGNGSAAVHLVDTAEVRSSWQLKSQEEWEAIVNSLPKPEHPPDPTAVSGQLLVQQALAIAQLQQQIDLIGKSIVQLLLK